MKTTESISIQRQPSEYLDPPTAEVYRQIGSLPYHIATPFYVCWSSPQPGSLKLRFCTKYESHRQYLGKGYDLRYVHWLYSSAGIGLYSQTGRIVFGLTDTVALVEQVHLDRLEVLEGRLLDKDERLLKQMKEALNRVYRP